MSSISCPLRIKFLSKVKTAVWLRQFPNNQPIINNCLYVFDRDETVYDWLIVYDDLPPKNHERFSLLIETLDCHPDNTLLITIEPPTIKYYGRPYTEQFAHVLTTQPPEALPHKQRIYNQAGLHWFYGVGEERIKSFNEIESNPPSNKTADLSLVWSNKKQRYADLHQRNKFLNDVKKNFPAVDIYGADHLPLNDKADAIDNNKYHLAIENYRGKHHWTEKVADVFLGGALPFYYGCPNLTDYFSEKSFISIDIFKINESLEIIQQSIANNEFEKRQEHIQAARKKILREYNLFFMLTEIINKHHTEHATLNNHSILSKRAANRSSLVNSLRYGWHKHFNRTNYYCKNLFNRRS